MKERSVEKWTTFICAIICALISINSAANGEVVPCVIFGLIFRWRATLFYKN